MGEKSKAEGDMGVWDEQAIVLVRGGFGVCANTFAINFIFLCGGAGILVTWPEGYGGERGYFQVTMSSVVSVLGSWKWERPMKRILKFNVLSMINFCCWHLPLEKDTDS